ncbi:MAG: carboxylate--amine ligase [Tissierellia bacterium]|nr:carboxylate--amine ligase [Tissierellia bacterium]
MEQIFKPVILGTDINAYGVARSFHQAYGIRSLCLGRKALRYTAHSKIVDVEAREDFEEDEVFLTVLREVAARYSEPLLLISCGDGYTSLITRHEEELRKLYRFNYIDGAMQEALENKEAFYRVCEEYGLPYPKTYTITYENRENFQVPFNFPVALKPNDSIAYLHVDFEGKKKAYRLDSEEELREVVAKIYATDYKGELILQDFIPGDFSKMYVLNAYVNTRGKVTMMCLGKCLLDECLPKEIGNYNALMTMGDMDIYKKYENFLQDIGYRGFANFDLKYDERDGEYKVFEINIRQGRSSYYMTAGGCNFVTYLVEDLLEGKDPEVHYHHDSALWLSVDPSVLRKYGAKEDRPLIERELKKGFAFTQWYEKDKNLKRYVDYMKRRISTIRYYPVYQPGRFEGM